MTDTSGQTNTIQADIPLDNLTTNEDELGVSDDKQTEEYSNRICWCELIIWIFFFILAIYNYITDFLVARDWSELRNLCPNFRQFDNYCEDNSEFEGAGSKLLVLTLFGFIFAMISKFYQLYIYYMIWKHCNSSEEKQAFEIKEFRCEMCSGWIPLIVEDIASLLIITLTFTSVADKVEGIDPELLQQSLIVTCLDLLLNYANFMRLLLFKKRKKIKETFNNKCVPSFCFVYWILMGIFLLIAIIVCFVEVNNVYTNDEHENLHIGNANTMAYIEMGTYGNCIPAQQRSPYGWIDEYDGIEDGSEFSELPTKIGSSQKLLNCNISYYKLLPECISYYDSTGNDDHTLNCTLKYWWYSGPQQFEMNCSNNEVLNQCTNFKIPFTTCGTYTIPCNFAEGNISFYACFDYCYYNL